MKSDDFALLCTEKQPSCFPMKSWLVLFRVKFCHPWSLGRAEREHLGDHRSLALARRADQCGIPQLIGEVFGGAGRQQDVDLRVEVFVKTVYCKYTFCRGYCVQ